MHASYYDHPRAVDDVIEMVGLDEKRHSRVKTLSGGQQRRLDVAPGIIGDPELLFLDEPTTGFDPSARRHAWDSSGACDRSEPRSCSPRTIWTKPKSWPTA